MITLNNVDNDSFKIMAVSVAITVSSIDVSHQWRLWHESEARMLFSLSILVFNYQTDMLLKSLNNRIIQILNLTLKLTIKTNPNA